MAEIDFYMHIYGTKDAVNVEELSSADVVERKHGKWTDISVYGIEDTSITDVQSAICSVCHKYHTTPYMYYFDNFNFCPNCGAEMSQNLRG